MSICVKNRKEISGKLWKLILEFSKATVCKSSTRNQLYVETSTFNQQPEHEIQTGNLDYVVSPGPACATQWGNWKQAQETQNDL